MKVFFVLSRYSRVDVYRRVLGLISCLLVKPVIIEFLLVVFCCSPRDELTYFLVLSNESSKIITCGVLFMHLVPLKTSKSELRILITNWMTQKEKPLWNHLSINVLLLPPGDFITRKQLFWERRQVVMDCINSAMFDCNNEKKFILWYVKRSCEASYDVFYVFTTTTKPIVLQTHCNNN